MSCNKAARTALGYAGARSYVTATRPVFYPRVRPIISRRTIPTDVSNISPVDITDASAASASSEEPAIESRQARQESETNATTKSVPWFMEYNKQFDKEFATQQRQVEPIPEIPSGSPVFLAPLLEYLARDLTLRDISLLDLRQKENPWGSQTIMIIATGTSERQLRSSAESLKAYLRDAGCKPSVDGIVKWEDTKVKRRRRRKMIGRANYQVEDDRLHWVLVDAGGNSGIILQLFSEHGRQEYALEELWAARANNEVSMPSEKSANDFARPSYISSRSSISGQGPLSRRLFSTFRQPSRIFSRPFSSLVQGELGKDILYISECHDPYINLAFENYLFRNAVLPSLLLYRNRPSVVIGRNQNPWIEANLAYLARHDIELVRRYSGGGAVYHDLGNTNYSFMMSRTDFDRDTTAQRIVNGLKDVGLDVKLNERHDIIVKLDGIYKKCSGSAYKIAKDRAYAHGTMLLKSDLGNLGPALKPEYVGIRGNGVDSVRSQVANLGLEHAEFCRLIESTFRFTRCTFSEEEMLSVPEVRSSADELRSHDWKFLQTPKFTQSLPLTSEENIVATIKQGRYVDLAGPERIVAELPELNGRFFDPDALPKTLLAINVK